MTLAPTNWQFDLMVSCGAQVGEMFIVCGILYGIDSVTERNTKIRLAIDLYRGIFLDDVNLAFSNPFKNTTMATYNHRLRVSEILPRESYSTFAALRFILNSICRSCTHGIEAINWRTQSDTIILQRQMARRLVNETMTHFIIITPVTITIFHKLISHFCFD